MPLSKGAGGWLKGGYVRIEVTDSRQGDDAESGLIRESTSGGEHLLLFVSLLDCPPCIEMKRYLDDVGVDRIPGLRLEFLSLTQEDFLTRCMSGELPVRFAPALLLYRNGSLIARIVGLRGKHGKVDGPFVARWLARHGLASPTASLPE
jgi:hypothetical protein